MLKRLVIASAWLACACGGGGKTEPAAPAEQPIENKAPAAEPAAAPALAPGSPEAVMAKLQEFGAKMCACKDNTCAEGVSNEMTKWSVEVAKTQTEPVTMTEQDQDRAVKIAQQMGECMQEAMTASPPKPPPP